MSWLTKTNSYYDSRAHKWAYVADHLSGDVLDKLATYLHQREQGEADKAYEFRQKIADWTPHYTHAIVALTGMLFAVEDDIVRTWTREEGGEGLGDPQDEGTIMRRLWHDADGRGTNWQALLAQASVALTAYQEVWGLVEGIPRDAEGNATGEASVRLIEPQAVLDFREESGRLVEVKVKSATDTRTSIEAEEEVVSQYFVYRLDRVDVYQEDEDGAGQLVRSTPYGEAGAFRYWATQRQREAVLPIFRVRVPLGAPMGYLMARKANAIFNLESATDFHLIASVFARLMVPDAVDDQGSYRKGVMDAITEAIKHGASILPGDNRYASPPMDGADARSQRLSDKIDAFYTTFFQSYGDSARERTATEIRQDIRSGVEAYLTLLSGALDELEQTALSRLEQVYFPDQPEVWGGATVSRSTDFSAVNIDERIDRIKSRYFGEEPVPVGRSGRASAARRIAEADEIIYDEDELNAAAGIAVARQQAEAQRVEASVEADRIFRAAGGDDAVADIMDELDNG